MKRFVIPAVVAMALLSVRGIAGAGLDVIPKVKEFAAAADGAVWQVPEKLEVIAEGPGAARVAALLKSDWAKRAKGQRLAGRTGTGRVKLRCGAPEPLPAHDWPGTLDECYELVIASDGVTIAAATRQGLFWGVQTLLQASRAGATVPCGRAVDGPDVGYRAFMLDAGRRFYPLQYLRDTVRQLAYYKMNVFHVHLSDDLVHGDMVYWAWRLESDLPGLTARDGHYTKAEFRAFVKEAAELGVMVIPELDSPGHVLPLVKVRPELALKGGWDHLDVENPKALETVKALWDEYLAGDDPVFSGPVVHAGCDEFFLKKNHYRAYVDGLWRHLMSRGRKVEAWGAFSHCTGTVEVVASKDVVIDVWHEQSYHTDQAVKDGYSIVSIPAYLPGARFYLIPDTALMSDDWVKGVVSGWNPEIGAGGEKTPREALRGSKFCLWNDHVGNGTSGDDCFDLFFPMIQAVAEKTWRAWRAEKGDALWTDFAARRAKIGEAPGLDYADLYNPDSLGWANGGWEVEFDLNPFDRPFHGCATTLFDDGYSKVWLLPTGQLGFSRDGYDFAFDWVPPANTVSHVKMSGTHAGTTLTVNGTPVQDLKPHKSFYDRKPGRWTYNLMRTLHFPVPVPVGRLAGLVRNFRVVRR